MSKRRRTSSIASRGHEDDSLDSIEASTSTGPSMRKRCKKQDPMELCQQLYELIRNHKKEDGTLLCDAFIRVPKRRQEPGYYEVVSNPIDLLKVQQKLKTDEYDDMDDLQSDVELLVNNAKAFYKRSSQEHRDACDLWELFVVHKNRLMDRTKRKRRSKLWNRFTRVDNQFAKCNICGDNMSYRTSITNLKKHLESKHLETIKQPQDTTVQYERASSASQNDESNAISGTTERIQQKYVAPYLPKKVSCISKESLDAHLLQLFTLDFQPFSVVEDRGFASFVAALNPAYQLPSRKAISNLLIPAMYERCRIASKKAAEKIKSTCLTADCWPGANSQQSFMAVTAHYIDDEFSMRSMLLECCSFPLPHTSKMFADELRRISEEWKLESKILNCISDNAGNIKNAVKSELGWKHFGCYAHTLNLIIQDALRLAHATIANVEIIVSHFKRSSKATAQLIENQRNAGIPVPKSLMQDARTQWISTFYMLQRFVELENAIRPTMANLDADLPVLVCEDWRILKELCIILKPIEKDTKELSGNTYMTASLVIPVTSGLKKLCAAIEESLELCESARNILHALNAGLETRLADIEYNDTLAACCFLDPRFKNIAFEDSNAADRAKANVINMVAEKISLDSKLVIKEEKITEPCDGKVQKFSVWQSYEATAASRHPQATAASRAAFEVQRYLEDELLNRHEDPIVWWKTYRCNYPYLKKVVQEKCCVLATSVPCEALFSKAGNVLTDRRNLLSNEAINQLLTLKVNSVHAI